MHTHHVCDTPLAQRLEQAEATTSQQYVAARATLRPDAGAATQAIGDGIALFAGTGSPLNRVVALGMTQPVAMTEIDACATFFGAHGETARIDLCPLAHPSLINVLQQANYAVAQFKHVLVRTLASWPDHPRPVTTIDVRPILVAETRLWAQVVAGAFHGGVPSLADLEIALPNPHKPDTVCFLAWVEGQPAGGGALAIQDGIALLYSTSVRPEWRRMGAQSALLHARLNYAKEHGCDLAMVQTTPGSASQRNVARVGFQIAYTKPTLVHLQAS